MFIVNLIGLVLIGAILIMVAIYLFLSLQGTEEVKEEKTIVTNNEKRIVKLHKNISWIKQQIKECNDHEEVEKLQKEYFELSFELRQLTGIRV